ncbi:hypothetical protein Gbro_1885 [Gordonia bronchialis DSM 43247]|uniref:Uncharacterized protein n=1 Tax=Gordonia bronchialis (strain ATCC 25592 / DSM 43247 / BCRC 13721 / JCM 3198 / KCTC 3076 / NBRC 16047 / NCTC 10667) TaxID=526226 RepID=D0L9F2_GORB4|nr:hypothetical protein [Gordonia bronchialis]ACY21140.1 hypothetical protein Gbro_1885 [Gordonia bronchialis DSM 43247]MCC3323925.1 hypothetical protein [Gordonia bronchialis]QGS25162.1 hypothetical protein FOB84_14415 [Gordonia bronchialis]STQ64009.1 Uncharacterised protein [Gordonia bronchialis]
MTDTTKQSGQPSRRSVEVAGGLLDRAQRLQAPAVQKYVASLREKYPDDSPAQIIRRLEKRYLTAVTGSGGAVGATAAVPGVGTMTAMGAMTGETAFFLEASALLALAIAEVHGIPLHDIERRKALVFAVALGEEGVIALGRVVGTRGGALRSLGGSSVPRSALTKLNKSLVSKLSRKYFFRKAPLMLGKLMPAGIGAVIGGVGGRALGRRVVHNAREAFGPPPSAWIIDATVVSDAALPPGYR